MNTFVENVYCAINQLSERQWTKSFEVPYSYFITVSLFSMTFVIKIHKLFLT